VIFLSAGFPCSVAAQGPWPSFFRQRTVYYRESTIGMYDMWIYSTAMFIVELIYHFICAVMFLIPFYFLVGFRNDATLFFRYLLVLWLMGVTISSMIQTWTAALSSQIVGNVVQSFFMTLFVNFTGFLLKPNAIPHGWKWFYYMNPMAKALSAILLGQSECHGPDCPTLIVPGTTTPIPIYEYYTTAFETNADDYGKWIGYLVLTIAVIRVMNFFALRFISHLKR